MDTSSILPRLIPTAIPPVVVRFASRFLGFDELGRTYSALQSLDSDEPFTKRVLDQLEIAYRVAPADLDHVPRKGATVVVANHPFGILEGAVLADALGILRPDVRFLANSVLSIIPELRNLVIPVDPMGGAVAGNPSGMRAAIEHLRHGGLLVVFPAGEVSHFQWTEKGSTDPEWNPAVARMLSIASRFHVDTTVVPLFVDGANSALFQMAGVIHPKLRTALLARELMNKRGAVVRLRIGKPVSSSKLRQMPSDEDRIAYLRWRTYLLAKRENVRPHTSAPLVARRPRSHRQNADIAPAVSPDVLQAEVNALPSNALLAQSGDLKVYMADASNIPSTLTEIGRLREITFRAAGEGTGRALDLDAFDSHYLHLFVWNSRKNEVVGAYRLMSTDLGPSKLYTNTLFHFGEEFLHRMGPALELGRSFIRSESQKGFAPLLLLWKGIGKYIAQNPRYKVLFGPVSISNQYQSISRELMISFLERSASLPDWTNLVRARNAPTRDVRVMKTSLCRDIEDLSDAVSDIEPSQAGIPVLLRQYLKLGGRLLSFNVDTDFSNALDGLIVVDLLKSEPKLLDRYLGRNEASALLNFHAEMRAL
jgi:putative hemolysin